MTPLSWPCPSADGGEHSEYALAFDRQRQHRVLVIPALLDEANKLRRFTVEVMRRLDGAGIDSFLPDLPGCNESTAALTDQTLERWTGAMLAAANHFRANQVLAIRGGGLVLPKVIPGWLYAPVKGASVLRQMLRARIIAARELGREETQAGLLETGAANGLELNGYALSPAMLNELQDGLPEARAGIAPIDQDLLGGSGLWLRAEPDEDAQQADALAAILAVSLAA